MIDYYTLFFREAPHLRIMVYSGDVDLATVPHGYTQLCLASMSDQVDLVQGWRYAGGMLLAAGVLTDWRQPLDCAWPCHSQLHTTLRGEIQYHSRVPRDLPAVHICHRAVSLPLPPAFALGSADGAVKRGWPRSAAVSAVLRLQHVRAMACAGHQPLVTGWSLLVWHSGSTDGRGLRNFATNQWQRRRAGAGPGRGRPN